MIKKPKKQEKIILRDRVITDAHFKDVDTGKKQVVEIVEDGVTRKEERPLVERVFVEAKREEVAEKKNVYVVEVEIGGVKETHEFATKADADAFYKGAS